MDFILDKNVQAVQLMYNIIGKYQYIKTNRFNGLSLQQILRKWFLTKS